MVNLLAFFQASSCREVCAAVHAHLARVDQGEEREEEEPQLNVDWATALGYWCEPQIAVVTLLGIIEFVRSCLVKG